MTESASPRWRLDHYGQESADIDGDVRAYQALGMAVARWGTHVGTGGRIALLHDGVAAKIELIEVDKVTGEMDHTAFAVDDLTAARSAALDQGFTEVTPVNRIEAARAFSCFIRSASGPLVQLISYDSCSPDIAPWKPLAADEEIDEEIEVRC